MTNFNLPSNPVKPEIRDIHFDFSQMDRKAWHSWHPDGPHVAHWFNSLSLTFPEGERFFVNSVRHYYDEVVAQNPEMKNAIRIFIGQEVMHTREHEAYNSSMLAAGYPIAKIEEVVRFALKIAKTFPAYAQLATTAALEHFTAVFAEQLLRSDGIVTGAKPDMVSLWRWHGNEELEHKRVAYDVLKLMTKRKPIGYLIRVASMMGTTIVFVISTCVNHITLIHADRKLLDFRGWLRFLKFFFIKPGFVRRILWSYLSYYRPGFHPSHHDNEGLSLRWRQQYAESGTPPSAW